MTNRAKSICLAANLEGWSQDASMLAGVERILEVLGEPTEAMEADGADAYLSQDPDNQPRQIAWAVWRAMWTARFRGGG